MSEIENGQPERKKPGPKARLRCSMCDFSCAHDEEEAFKSHFATHAGAIAPVVEALATISFGEIGSEAFSIRFVQPIAFPFGVFDVVERPEDKANPTPWAYKVSRFFVDRIVLTPLGAVCYLPKERRPTAPPSLLIGWHFIACALPMPEARA